MRGTFQRSERLRARSLVVSYLFLEISIVFRKSFHISKVHELLRLGVRMSEDGINMSDKS